MCLLIHDGQRRHSYSHACCAQREPVSFAGSDLLHLSPLLAHSVKSAQSVRWRVAGPLSDVCVVCHSESGTLGLCIAYAALARGVQASVAGPGTGTCCKACVVKVVCGACPVQVGRPFVLRRATPPWMEVGADSPVFHCNVCSTCGCCAALPASTAGVLAAGYHLLGNVLIICCAVTALWKMGASLGAQPVELILFGGTPFLPLFTCTFYNYQPQYQQHILDCAMHEQHGHGWSWLCGYLASWWVSRGGM